ncbi:MAG TPA: alpha/beta hydrolase, partial [bacterium]
MGIAKTMMLSGLLTLLAAGCTETLPVRYKESGLNSSFRYSGMAYPEYIAHMKRVIGQSRKDLTPENRERVIEWNAPFILEPDPAKCPALPGNRYRRGILLIHGLTDSPFHMRDLGEWFRGKCFLVYGLLLPGHGTVPGDLLTVTREDWEKATQYGIAALRPRVEKLYAGGFSTGGALLVREALNGERFDGLFLFAPALGLNTIKAAAAPVVSGVRPWDEIAPDEDPAKYESFTTNAAAQIWRLIHELSFKIDKEPVKSPIFLAVSADDQTIDPRAVVDFYTRVADTRSRAIIYSKAAQAKDPRFLYVDGANPAENVLDMAHLSLTNAPSNPHYGQKGDYRNCMHYYPQDMARWNTCKAGQGPAGEKTKENLAKG